MNVPISNDFHNTETCIRWPKGMHELFLTDAQARRVGNRLCGSTDCTCSGIIGIRGIQPLFLIGDEQYSVEYDVWYRGKESGVLLSLHIR